MKNEALRDDETRIVTCKRCGWTGKLRFCKETHYRSECDAWHKHKGTDVFQYWCPECKLLVAQDIRESIQRRPGKQVVKLRA